MGVNKFQSPTGRPQSNIFVTDIGIDTVTICSTQVRRFSPALLFLSQAWYCGCSSYLFRNLHFPGILNWQPTADHAMLWFFIFIIFNLEHKWTRLMLYPLRNTFRKTHESSRKPIKTTSLKPGDGITLMRIFYLSGKIPENTAIFHK